MRMSWFKGLWMPERTRIVPDAQFWVALTQILDYVYRIGNKQNGQWLLCEQWSGPMLESLNILEDWFHIALQEGWIDEPPTDS